MKIVERFIRSIAWDATVGRGNSSEEVDYAPLNEAAADDLHRAATDSERRTYAEAWRHALQEMAQA